jgi:mRNA-degrading endonuclease toxin of MazEF toxin-antitoxin module
VNRGEVWFAEVGRRLRHVLILTRAEVLDVRALVTVAEIATTIRGLAAEVKIDHVETGLENVSVVNPVSWPMGVGLSPDGQPAARLDDRALAPSCW